jgi:3-oxoacyl-[acyl-carrier-protein] synthase II
LVEGRSGAKKISSFDASSYPTQVAGEIIDFDPFDFMPYKTAKHLDRSTQMILASAIMAVDDSELSSSPLPNGSAFLRERPWRTSVGLRQYEIFKEKGIKRISPFTAVTTFPNASSSQISFHFGLKGPSDTISSGCVSSTVALGYGFENIRRGDIDVALVGGTEAPLHPGIFGAYCAARVMTHSNYGSHTGLHARSIPSGRQFF